MVGAEAEVTTDEQRVRPAGSEVEVLLSDPANARARLGWEPRTSLEDGLAATAAWLDEREMPTATATRYHR